MINNDKYSPQLYHNLLNLSDMLNVDIFLIFNLVNIGIKAFKLIIKNAQDCLQWCSCCFHFNLSVKRPAASNWL